MSDYDRVPYVARVHNQTHPDTMRALAHLFGHVAPPLSKARVLELGCASGTNLLGLAGCYPEAQFLGVDGSAVQIEQGRQDIRTTGVENLELVQADIRDVDTSLGTFDYILCHGVFSWVPEDVRDAILRVAKQNLAHDGIAYISYNVLPGWYQRMAVRDLMLLHAEGFDDPYRQIEQSRAILDFVVENHAGQLGYGRALKEVQFSVQQHTDAYVFHEYLEGNNHPLYFRDFAKMSREAGLQYLGETSLDQMLTQNLGKPAHDLLEQLDDLVRIEQYQDFLRNRTFRASMLVHADREVVRHVEPHDLYTLRIGCAFSIAMEGELDVRDDSKWTFKSVADLPFDTAVPLMKAALIHLARSHPVTQPFSTIVEQARDLAGSTASVDEDREQLASALLSCLAKGFITVSCEARPRVGYVSEHPRAWPLARRLAEHREQVPTLNHTNASLQPLPRLLLRHMDGERSRDALVDLVVDEIEADRLEAQWHEGRPDSATTRRQAIAEVVLKHLDDLVKQGLVIE